MNGKLVDKVTGEVITDAEGNEITTSETFIAEEKDGSIDITFKFDSSALAGSHWLHLSFLPQKVRKLQYMPILPMKVRPSASRRFIQQQPIR